MNKRESPEDLREYIKYLLEGHKIVMIEFDFENGEIIRQLKQRGKHIKFKNEKLRNKVQDELDQYI